MKIIGVIPARYKSTRFEGKPLADICGKPMIWWVYNQVRKVKELNDVIIATDDKRVSSVCKQYNMNYLMTSEKHSTHLDRLSEFAQKIEADFYINVNGDEPLMMPEYVEELISFENVTPNNFYFANAMTKIKKPVEVFDISRIKVVTDSMGYAMYMARSPIPYPKASSNFDYMKFVGIQCFSRPALLFCGKTPRGRIENIEDIDEYRFLENGKKIKFVEVSAETLSVDTKADLLVVRDIISERIKRGDIIMDRFTPPPR
jgi:3-deoxy-manno-octulosonate cytidylyltransferase (CMP-KDO synthetase)